ncbi:MAG: hypothetical protein SCI24_17230, partial [Halomonas sp.]|nr:hypothetical protein [Halomonas sp.]
VLVSGSSGQTDPDAFLHTPFFSTASTNFGKFADERVDELLLAGRLADSRDAALARLDAALASGAAAERFARMVAGLGGPNDLLERPGHHLPEAPVTRAVHAEDPGRVQAMDTRVLGLAVVALGGGRSAPGEAIDPAVGLSRIASLGEAVDAERPLALVHAASAADADRAARQVREAIRVGEGPATPPPLIHDIIRREAP